MHFIKYLPDFPFKGNYIYFRRLMSKIGSITLNFCSFQSIKWHLNKKFIENHPASQHNNNSDRMTEIGNNQKIISSKENKSLVYIFSHHRWFYGNYVRVNYRGQQILIRYLMKANTQKQDSLRIPLSGLWCIVPYRLWKLFFNTKSLIIFRN